MKTNKRLTLYPSARATRILGESAPNLNSAIEVFADAIAQETTRIKDQPREFWNFAADVLNGFIANDSIQINKFLAAEFEDAETIEGKAKKWNLQNFEKLVDWLNEDADQMTGWAILCAVRFFWDNHEKIDMNKDRWWTIPFRLAFEE